jgi:hypothetical protein
VDTFERELFLRFGYPRALLSDNGPQFVSKAMGEALKRWGSEGWTTPIYHPRANPVERRNQELKKGLRTTLLVDKPHHLWDVYLPHVLFSVRNRENRNTVQSPAKMMFGREIKGPGDWQLELAEKSQEESGTGPEFPEAGRNASEEPGVSSVKPDDAHVKESAEKRVHAGFAPKWLGPVRLCK